jgi:hypothetical protein
MTALLDAAPRLALALKPGWSAYVDADWIGEEEDDAIPALLRTPDGALVFGGITVKTTEAVAPDEAAAAVLETVALSALELVAAVDGGRIEVLGHGAIAERIRDGAGRPNGGAPLDVVVDATGDPALLAEALGRLRDEGTLLLVGERAGRTASFDPYPDLHRRGLRLIGAPRPLTVLPASWTPAAFEPPAAVRLGEPPAAEARWYRVDA